MIFQEEGGKGEHRGCTLVPSLGRDSAPCIQAYFPSGSGGVKLTGEERWRYVKSLESSIYTRFPGESLPKNAEKKKKDPIKSCGCGLS